MPSKNKRRPSAATIRRRIRDRNRRFRALTPAEKRVAIAKDVIAQLDAKRLLAQSGTYFATPSFSRAFETLHDFRNRPEDESTRELGQTQVCELLEDTKCTVCGIGAAFVSAVRLGNNLTVEDVGGYIGDGEMREYLNRYFDADQVALIECAFEHCPNFAIDAHGRQPSEEDAAAAADFGALYRTDSARMCAIFQNVIENGGRFKPTVGGDQ